jgi:hypothetical protein
MMKGSGMNKQQWTVLNPLSQVESAGDAPSRRIDRFEKKTIGLYWNGKPNGDVFLDEVAHQLSTRFDGLSFVKFWETRPDTRTVYGNSPDSLQSMARAADFVIAASAD